MTDPYIVTETELRKDGTSLSLGHVYKVYPEAIKDAIMEFMRNHRYLSSSDQITTYYIELDRKEEQMVAVIEQK